MNKIIPSILSIFMIISCAKTEIIDFSIANTELTMYVTQETQLKVSVSYTGTDELPMHWESSNSNIVRVDSVGNLYALKAGTSTITVSCLNEARTCEVTVVNEEYVLLAGEDGKIGHMTVIKDGESRFTSQTIYNVLPTNMCIDNNNIYVCGNAALTSDSLNIPFATYWKNNVVNLLEPVDASSIGAEAKAIAVRGDTIAIAGSTFSLSGTDTITAAVIWINSNPQKFGNNSVATDVAIYNEMIVACGSSEYKPVEWINGREKKLSDNYGETVKTDFDTSGNRYTFGVISSDINNEYGKLTLWENGEIVIPLPAKIARPISMCIYNDEIYLLAEERNSNGDNVPFIIYENEISYLDVTTGYYEATDIAVTDNTVLVTAKKIEFAINGDYTTCSPVIWRNGVEESVKQTYMNEYPVAILIR